MARIGGEFWAYYNLHKLQSETVIQNVPKYFNPFSFCSSCQRKFDDCRIVNEETMGSIPFANGSNEGNVTDGSARLCIYAARV